MHSYTYIHSVESLNAAQLINLYCSEFAVLNYAGKTPCLISYTHICWMVGQLKEVLSDKIIYGWMNEAITIK